MSIGTDPKPLTPEQERRIRKAGPEGTRYVFDDGFIEVTPGQKIYFMRLGNPNGVPAINLHGGPGTGSGPSHANLFLLEPEVFNAVLFDQPGCGDSTPAASGLDEAGVMECANTDNIEHVLSVLRQKFFQDRPVILQGTSWGSTMPLVYAERHGKQEVFENVIGSIFFGTEEETSGMFDLHHDPNFPFKKEHEDFLDDLSQGDLELRERLDQMSGREMVLYLGGKTFDLDPITARRNAIIGEAYEYMLCRRDGQQEDGNAYRTLRDEEEGDTNVLSHARIEFTSHANRAWLKENEIEDNIGNLDGIHTTIVQGERDMCTPEKYAWKLHNLIQRAGGSSTIEIVKEAGHLRSDKNMKAALQKALLASAARYREKYGA